MNVLYIGFPLLPIDDATCGGAEQVLSVLERAMHARGHRTAVAAADGSRCTGELLPTGPPAETPDQLAQRERAQWDAIRQALRRRALEPDIIHDHSGGFWQHAHEIDMPVLATLHLPRRMYAPELFDDLPANVFFNCVSQSQAQAFPDLPGFVGVVENGVDLERFPLQNQKDDFVLWLGRICEEKGPHLAIAAARQAGVRLVLAGDVYPFSYHQEFWEREIAPAIDGAAVSFIRQPSFTLKLDLLQRAQAVLIPSVVDETSSLVALEAMACGTPVIAFRRGALPQLVADDETGFIVDSVAEMAHAISRAPQIDPAACREHVATRHSFAATVDGYERLYEEVVGRARADRLAAAS